MKNQSPRSKEWKEYLDKSLIESLEGFEQEPNDTASIPNNELVTYDSSVRDGHDYRHLANAYVDMGLVSDEPNTRAPKSILKKVAKTARGRLYQAIADEHQMDHMESEMQSDPEENLIKMQKEGSETEVEGPDHWPMSVFEEEGMIDAEIEQTREELKRWEDFADDMAKVEIQRQKRAEAEKPIEAKWAKADQAQEVLEKRGLGHRSDLWSGHGPSEDQTRSKKDIRNTLMTKLPRIKSEKSVEMDRIEREEVSHSPVEMENGEIQLFAHYAKNPILIGEEVEMMEKGRLGLGSLNLLASELYDIHDRIPAQDKWALNSVNHLIGETHEQIEDYEYERKVIAEFMREPEEHGNDVDENQLPEEIIEAEEGHWIPETEVDTAKSGHVPAKHNNPVANLAEFTEKKIDKEAMDREIAEREERQYKVHAPTSGDRQNRAREINKIRRSGRKAA